MMGANPTPQTSHAQRSVSASTSVTLCFANVRASTFRVMGFLSVVFVELLCLLVPSVDAHAHMGLNEQPRSTLLFDLRQEFSALPLDIVNAERH